MSVIVPPVPAAADPSGTDLDPGPHEPAAPRRGRRRAGALVAVVTFALLLMLLSPALWMISSSLHSNSELTARPPAWGLSGASLTEYSRILTTPRFLTYFKNSAIVSLGTVAITLVVAVLAAYPFSRFRFPGRGLLLLAVLSVQMFPVVAILISLFDIYRRLGLINTYPGLILSNTTLALPFAIWFLKSFYDSIPKELEEAARVDGCGRLGVLWRVILPLTRPGLLAVGTYAFLMAWDDFVIALTLTTSDDMRTLPVGIALAFAGEFNYDWAGMMTISVVTTTPVLLVFLLLQKHMVAGLTAGAVKG